VRADIITFEDVRAGLIAAGATDVLDWQRGAIPPATPYQAFTVLPNGTRFQSDGGVRVTANQTVGLFDSFERRDEGLATGWLGVFTPGDHLLWTRGPNGPINLMFFDRMNNPLPVNLVGANVQRNQFGDYTATIQALDRSGNPIPGSMFTSDSINTSAEDGSAAFMGLESNRFDIYGIRLGLQTPGPLPPPPIPQDLAINQLNLHAIPEIGGSQAVCAMMLLAGVICCLRARRTVTAS
jgi:hypothetical protein